MVAHRKLLHCPPAAKTNWWKTETKNKLDEKENRISLIAWSPWEFSFGDRCFCILTFCLESMQVHCWCGSMARFLAMNSLLCCSQIKTTHILIMFSLTRQSTVYWYSYITLIAWQTHAHFMRVKSYARKLGAGNFLSNLILHQFWFMLLISLHISQSSVFSVTCTTLLEGKWNFYELQKSWQLLPCTCERR